MTTADDARFLARHFLFQDLDPALLDQVAALCVRRRLGAGETLFLKGDEGDALYGILDGVIRIGAMAPSGREIILNVLEAGDVFGEIALLDGLPRSADAVALNATELLVLRRRDFLPLLEREPRLAIHLLELLCERVRWTSELIEDAAFLGVPARLAKRLLGLATVYGRPVPDGVQIELKISQSTLGQMMGTSRETINKILQSWRKEGWIALEHRHVVVRDRSALEAVVAGDAAAGD